MLITKKNYKTIAEQIINQHYTSLLLELNIPSTVINVKSESFGHREYGKLRAAQRVHPLLAGLSTNGYIHDKSYIDIYALEHLYAHVRATNIARIRTVFFYKQYEKKIVDTLAHELRHVWQWINDEHTECSMVRSVVPYSMLHSEIDARTYSKDYVKRMV
jgi:hypothetical protein